VFRIKNESIRQLCIGAVQLVGMAAVYLRDVYVPAFGIAGVMVWLAAGLALAFWMDSQDGRGLPWRYALTITALMLGNFALFFAALKAFGNAGLIAAVPFLWFGSLQTLLIAGLCGLLSRPATASKANGPGPIFMARLHGQPPE
jgi:hypothetical protein